MTIRISKNTELRAKRAVGLIVDDWCSSCGNERNFEFLFSDLAGHFRVALVAGTYIQLFLFCLEKVL
jgi:hypothetical protein